MTRDKIPIQLIKLQRKPLSLSQNHVLFKGSPFLSIFLSKPCVIQQNPTTWLLSLPPPLSKHHHVLTVRAMPTQFPLVSFCSLYMWGQSQISNPSLSPIKIMPFVSKNLHAKWDVMSIMNFQLNLCVDDGNCGYFPRFVWEVRMRSWDGKNVLVQLWVV